MQFAFIGNILKTGGEKKKNKRNILFWESPQSGQGGY